MATTPTHPATMVPAPEVVVPFVLPLTVVEPGFEAEPVAVAVAEPVLVVLLALVPLLGTSGPAAPPSCVAPPVAVGLAALSPAELAAGMLAAGMLGVLEVAVPDGVSGVAAGASDEVGVLVPWVMLNWFCGWGEGCLSAFVIVLSLFSLSRVFPKAHDHSHPVTLIRYIVRAKETHRLRVDLLGLGAVGEVDLEGGADGQLGAVDDVFARVGVDVGREQDRRRGVAGHVAQVDVERVLVAGHGVPLDGLRPAGRPHVVLGRLGDPEGGHGGGEREEGDDGDHCCGLGLGLVGGW